METVNVFTRNTKNIGSVKKMIYSDATLQYLQSFAHASSLSFCDEQEKITMILLMKPSPKIFQIKKKFYLCKNHTHTH